MFKVVVPEYKVSLEKCKKLLSKAKRVRMVNGKKFFFYLDAKEIKIIYRLLLSFLYS